MRFVANTVIAALCFLQVNGQNQTEAQEKQYARDAIKSIPRPELDKVDQAYDWVDDHEYLAWFFNKTEAERMKMASDANVWTTDVAEYREKYKYLLDLQAKM